LTSLARWVLGIVLLLAHPDPRNVPRLRELVIISIVIADAAEETPDPYGSASLLTAIAHFESGFAIHAVGRQGEQGPWQLMPPAPTKLRAQAFEALRRWRILTPCGFSGEHPPHCPLASHRALLAAMTRAAFAPD
jgi:hypothetical protein